MSDDIGESQRSKGRQESEYGNEQKLEGIVRVVKRVRRFITSLN